MSLALLDAGLPRASLELANPHSVPPSPLGKATAGGVRSQAAEAAVAASRGCAGSPPSDARLWPFPRPSDATSVEGLEATTTPRDDPRDPWAADVGPVPATRLPLARQIPDEEATTTNKARAVFLVLGLIS